LNKIIPKNNDEGRAIYGNLENKINKYQSFDQYIAKKNNMVQAYEKFWAPIYIILN
jgi:hypothetical protein